MSHSRNEELDSKNNAASSSRGRASESENAPLLDVAGPSRGFRRHHHSDSPSLNIGPELHTVYHSSDESYFFDFIMEKVKSTRLAHFVDKLAVESEPGLTNAQLMLNNHDLKPVEPERRQWGPWNFVGFWVADSFNIVSLLEISHQEKLEAHKI
jgi:nucleobase:cation symporter-1, NCS1 family